MDKEKKSMIDSELVAINLGLNQFAESLENQDIEVVKINWSPPAGGDQEMQALLDELI